MCTVLCNFKTLYYSHSNDIHVHHCTSKDQHIAEILYWGALIMNHLHNQSCIVSM